MLLQPPGAGLQPLRAKFSRNGRDEARRGSTQHFFYFFRILTKSNVNPTPARFLFPNMLLRLRHDAGDSRARHFCRNPAWEFFPLAWRVCKSVLFQMTASAKFFT